MLVTVELIAEAQAHAAEPKQLLDVLPDKLVGLCNGGLGHKNDIIGLQLKIGIRIAGGHDLRKIYFQGNRKALKKIKRKKRYRFTRKLTINVESGK